MLEHRSTRAAFNAAVTSHLHPEPAGAKLFTSAPGKLELKWKRGDHLKVFPLESPLLKYSAKEEVSWFEGRKEDLSVALEEQSVEVATQVDGEEDQENCNGQSGRWFGFRGEIIICY